jgi:hypothetical protein
VLSAFNLWSLDYSKNQGLGNLFEILSQQVQLTVELPDFF